MNNVEHLEIHVKLTPWIITKGSAANQACPPYTIDIHKTQPLRDDIIVDKEFA